MNDEDRKLMNKIVIIICAILLTSCMKVVEFMYIPPRQGFHYVYHYTANGTVTWSEEENENCKTR